MKIHSTIALLGVLASVAMVVQGKAAEKNLDEAAAKAFMKRLNEEQAKLANRKSIARWNYVTNITDYNEAIQLKVKSEAVEEEKKLDKEIKMYPWEDYKDEDLLRQYGYYSGLGYAALPKDKYQRLMKILNEMQTTYSRAAICDYKNRTRCNLHLNPEITEIFDKSEDPEELKYAWLQFNKVAGVPSRGIFTEYVKLKNEAARLNGFASMAEWLLGTYEADDIEVQLADLWTKIKPLYLQIHAYVRRKLRLKYGEHIVSKKGPIPTHLVGDIWASNWVATQKFTLPFPNKTDVDITPALVAQKYTPIKMFKTAEEFFVSLNFSAMPETFWTRSILEKPTDGRLMDCHATAWDFSDGQDFRISACTTVKADWFTTCHHEMGHIVYQMQYSTQPFCYQNGANSGFHEAIGDTIAMSVTTPKHLKIIGLLEDGPEDEESRINQLFVKALDNVVFLPFGYLIDLYRYRVFRGTISPEDYNCQFWRLKEEYQGVEPPASRSEKDFDPAAKYHVSNDVEYMRYYISNIIQFQFYRSLCLIAGEFSPTDPSKPLSNCDFYKSTDAGKALGNMLKMGSSKPWPDAMETLTGQRKMLADGVLEYFEPLYKWLKAENEKTNEFIGWEHSKVEFCTAEQRKRLGEP